MKRKPSKVSQALAYLKDNPGATPYLAAKSVGMKPQPLYQRIKRDRELGLGICPTCHQKLSANKAV